MLIGIHTPFGQTLIKPSKISDANKVISLFFQPLAHHPQQPGVGCEQRCQISRIILYPTLCLLHACLVGTIAQCNMLLPIWFNIYSTNQHKSCNHQLKISKRILYHKGCFSKSNQICLEYVVPVQETNYRSNDIYWCRSSL